MLVDLHALQAPLPFLLYSVLLASVYLILFLVFSLLCLCRPRKRPFMLSTLLDLTEYTSRSSSNASGLNDAGKSSTAALIAIDTSPYSSPAHENEKAVGRPKRPPTQRIRASRNIVIFCYVCLRAFTIFLFTFSVGLSLVLSLESDSFKTLLSCVQNARADRIRDLFFQETPGSRSDESQSTQPLRVLWIHELKKLEDLTRMELERQTKQYLNQSSTCEMQEMRSSSDFGLEMDNTASIVTSRSENDFKAGNDHQGRMSNNYLNMWLVVNATWDKIEAEYWGPYNSTIRAFMENMRSLIDNQLLNHWTPYATLLDNMIDNAWLITARRAMKSPNEDLRNAEATFGESRRPSSRSVSGNYLAGLTPVNPREVDTLTFSSFLGIPQPASARLIEAQLWNKLRQSFPELQRLTYVPPKSRQHLTSHLQDPFLFFIYRHLSTVDDLDIPSKSAQRKLSVLQKLQTKFSTNSGLSDRPGAVPLRAWVNFSYLRIYLLVLDAYLIVSRFHAACRNFFVLWLGKRRRVFKQYSKAFFPNDSPTRRVGTDFNETDSQILEDIDHQTDDNFKDFNPDLIQTVLKARKSSAIPRGTVTSANDFGRHDYGHNFSQPFANDQHSPEDNYFCENLMENSRKFGQENGVDYVGFTERGSLPACCCCLNFHYLVILFAIVLMILGFTLSLFAERKANNAWLLKRSAMLTQVEAMEEYQRLSQSTVNHIQSNYYNFHRLPLERARAEKQLRTLKRLNSWLSFEKEAIAKQNMYEMCSFSETMDTFKRKYFTSLDQSICQEIKQMIKLGIKSDRSGQSLFTLNSPMKVPVCTFLPIHPFSRFSKKIAEPKDEKKNLGFELSPTSRREHMQLQDIIFKNSSFSAFVTSLYRLIFTIVVVAIGVCWLLACKYLVTQMSLRTVAVQTHKVTVISLHPSPPRRIETFSFSTDSLTSCTRNGSRNIWHEENQENSNQNVPASSQRRSRKGSRRKSSKVPTTESSV